jgi:hypothetical protein
VKLKMVYINMIPHIINLENSKNAFVVVLKRDYYCDLYIKWMTIDIRLIMDIGLLLELLEQIRYDTDGCCWHPQKMLHLIINSGYTIY